MSEKEQGSNGNGNEPKEGGGIEKKMTNAYQKIATTNERVGILIGTFTAGVVALFFSTISSVKIDFLPWIGAGLIVASLFFYVWLTMRSTVKAQIPPPPLQDELKELIKWMQEEITEELKGYRSRGSKNKLDSLTD